MGNMMSALQKLVEGQFSYERKIKMVMSSWTLDKTIRMYFADIDIPFAFPTVVVVLDHGSRTPHYLLPNTRNYVYEGADILGPASPRPLPTADQNFILHSRSSHS